MAYFQEFPLSVIEKLDYYVYLLLDPENNQVFYIGKGTGNRIFAHINAALSYNNFFGRVGDLNDSEGWLDNETFVLTREVEIRKSDGVPYERLSEDEQKILDADSSLVDYRIEKINAKRPLLETAV